MEQDEPNGELTAQQHAELLLLYQVSVDDLAFFKKQQWQIANYSLLLYAALVTLAQLLRRNSTCSDTLICLVATVVFLVAAWVLWELKKSIELRRKRLRRVRKYFSTRFFQAWQVRKTPNDALILFFVLIGVLAMGLFFVWWLVYFTQNPWRIARPCILLAGHVNGPSPACVDLYTL